MWQHRCLKLIAAGTCILAASAAAAQETNDSRAADESQARILRAKEHMQKLKMSLVDGGDAVELFDRPLLTYGDSARANENGTLWAFGKSGRPLVFLELYRQSGGNPRWVHAITLTSTQRVAMTTPLASRWTPEKTQIEPAAIPGAEAPAGREPVRLRQMKDLARRFTAHEFWDPDNSRFELRLLVQPVERYQNAEGGIQDGTAFVLAHGTNPEVIMLVEALGKKLDDARWHYSLARLGSAELHVELDGKEVWKRERTPGVVGRPTDPYWLFLSPVETEE